MLPYRLFPIASFCASIWLILGQTPTQPAPKPQSPPAPQQSTTGTPPPPAAVNGLTPPIQSQTPTPQVPPMIDIAPSPTATPGIPNAPITADEAAAIALHNQPNIFIAEGVLMSSRGNVVSARSALVPNIGLKESYGQSDTFYSHGLNNNQFNVTTGGTGGATGATTGATTGFTTGATTGTTGATTGTTGATTGTTGATTGTTGGTTGTSSGTTGNNSGGSGSSSGLSGSLTLSQLIFDFNHTRDLVRAAEAQERSSRQDFTKAQIDTILTVKQDFYTFVQNEGQVSVQEAAVTSAQASLDVAQAQLNAGLGAPADVVNAKTALANAIQTLLQARETMVTSRVTLCQAMGIDPRTPVIASTTATEAAESSADMNALVKQALAARPDVLSAEELVKAAGYELSAARTNNAPSLQLDLSTLHSGDNETVINRGVVSGQLNLTWNFDDGGNTAGKIESAKGDQLQAVQNLRLVQLGAESDVSTSWESVKVAEQRVDVANTQVQNAEENLRLAQGQYAAGVTPFVTVITAQQSLTQARSDQVTAVANLSQARATLRHAVGQGL